MTDQPPDVVTSTPHSPEAPPIPVTVFCCAILYLLVLVAVFAIYACRPSLQQKLPSNLGPLPMGVVWFGATGAVIASLRGIFAYNKHWDPSYNYWHYSRPLFGMVTGSVGALLYWVSLRLGNSGPIKVDHATFYAVAFVLGFADKSFTELLKSVTDIIIKPGQPNPPQPHVEGSWRPKDGDSV